MCCSLLQRPNSGIAAPTCPLRRLVFTLVFVLFLACITSALLWCMYTVQCFILQSCILLCNVARLLVQVARLLVHGTIRSEMEIAACQDRASARAGRRMVKGVAWSGLAWLVGCERVGVKRVNVIPILDPARRKGTQVCQSKQTHQFINHLRASAIPSGHLPGMPGGHRPRKASGILSKRQKLGF
jgi:hypothetical protein